MTETSKYTVGLRFGGIAGVLYVILLFCRFHFFASDPSTFFSFTQVSYLVIVLTFLLCGMARKKELGVYAEVREIFQSIFITILIVEGVYVLFVFIYMKFIDPGFLDHFRESSLAYFHKQKLPVSEIDRGMKGIDSITEQAKPAGLVKGFGTGVVVDSIFGFIFAGILRRKKPVQVETKQ